MNLVIVEEKVLNIQIWELPVCRQNLIKVIKSYEVQWPNTPSPQIKLKTKNKGERKGTVTVVEEKNKKSVS